MTIAKNWPLSETSLSLSHFLQTVNKRLFHRRKCFIKAKVRIFSQYSGSTFLYYILIESRRPVDHVTVCLFQKVLHYDG